jgi:hypothetical protein
MVYSGTECMLILEITIVSKSLAAVHEVLNNVYPDKEVPNKITIH